MFWENRKVTRKIIYSMDICMHLLFILMFYCSSRELPHTIREVTVTSQRADL